MKFFMEPEDWNYFSAIQAVAESLFKLADNAKQAESQQEVERLRLKMNELIKQLAIYANHHSNTDKPTAQGDTL